MEQLATKSAPEYTLEPPPQREYPTEEDAVEALHSWTRAHNFNVSKQKCEKNKYGKVRCRLFACDRAGKPKNTRKIQDADRQRPMRRTKRSGCPMRTSVVAVDGLKPDAAWKISYTKDGSKTHNHTASEDIRVHVAHRQRDAKRIRTSSQLSTNDFVILQTAAGVSTAKIHATMCLNDNSTLVLPKDISNAKAAARSKLLATQTSSEALFQLLREHGFHHVLETDPETDRLRYLLWAHPKTTQLARDFMDILVLDRTYKTNLHNLPLLMLLYSLA